MEIETKNEKSTKEKKKQKLTKAFELAYVIVSHNIQAFVMNKYGKRHIYIFMSTNSIHNFEEQI